MDYPSNSQRVTSRDDAPKAESKKVEKVTTGEVIRRKKTLGKRFSETFVGGDARGVWSYVAVDVIVPAIKDTVADAFTQAVERMLFGDSRSVRRRGSSYHGSNGHFNYQSRYSPSSSIRQGSRDEPRGISRRARATHDFDEIVLTTRVEAEEVIEHLFELVSRFDQATVEDLYDLVGITGNYTDRKWGWTDIRGAGVTRVKGGYLLDLPRPDPLD